MLYTPTMEAPMAKGTKGTKSMYDGLETKSPKNAGDSSRTLRGSSVNTAVAHTTTAKNQPNPGPRAA